MYQWTVFLHAFFAFVFILLHGGSAVVVLSFRREDASHPMVVSMIGIAGLALILWLMQFKPF